MTNFLECVKIGSYKEAKRFIENMSCDELCQFIIELGFDADELSLYTFVTFLLIEKETPELHYCAAVLISQVFAYIEGAYSMGLFHARRAMEMAPEDPSYKEYLLLYHDIPDKLLTRKEAIAVAKELEFQDPGNLAAKSVLQAIQNGDPERK
jgi:hypothetical protein